MGIRLLGGIHLTGLAQVSRSPWATRRGAFQAGRVPPPSRRDRRYLLRRWVDDEILVANRVVGDGELEDAVEHQASAAGATTVEAEHELVQVVGQVSGVPGALVGAQPPPLR